MSVTVKDLSAKCGLSVSTVSKALNNYPDISIETKELVRKAADEIGYRPNAIARGLKIGRTFNLGVLYSDDNGSGFTHNYFSPILESFKREAECRGYDITFITHHMGQKRMTYLEHCRYRNVDGVCIVNSHFTDPEVVELMSSGFPLVTVDHLYNDRTCIQSANRQGMEELTRYIIGLGHTRIAYVHGDNLPVTNIRLTSFLRTVKQAGIEIPENYLVPARYHDPSAARDAVFRLLECDDRPTCIIMPDDYAALGGMEAIRAHGLRIPDDISVAGYDGVDILQLCRPRLTTLKQDTASIGREAARQLVHLIERPRLTFSEVITVPGQLISGESVKALL